MVNSQKEQKENPCFFTLFVTYIPFIFTRSIIKNN